MRVALRTVETPDIDEFYEHQREPEGVAMAVFPSRDRAAHDAHWQKILADPTCITRTIVVDGAIAGNLGSWRTPEGRAVGYWLGRAFWGRGIATLALALFVAEVRERPLIAHVARANVGSIRVLEKCGFRSLRDGDDPIEIVMQLA